MIKLELMDQISMIQRGLDIIKETIEKDTDDHTKVVKPTPPPTQIIQEGKDPKKNLPKEKIEKDTDHTDHTVNLEDFNIYEIIENMISESELDNVLGEKPHKKTVEILDETKVISDKFCVNIETLYPGDYSGPGVKMPINTNIKKIEDIEYVDIFDGGGEFILKYTPNGEHLKLYPNRVMINRSNLDVFTFNTDENSLYRNDYFRTSFQKSHYWELQPFIEYNSDGTVKSKIFKKGDFELEYIDSDGESIGIELENINFQ